jgi:hypothetical protein
LLLAMVPTAATLPRGVGTATVFLQQYFPYWTALLLWLLLCRRLNRAEGNDKVTR